ncbi:helix-turn-helix domain-containing protein [Actinoplanes friuliensis]|uniref:Putative AraC-family transcriptional regulator n=1 Tax=Actinoplanes friuliensis DSM 7358 TaxID=1246995 RepID=U5W688_9ACTN|nr:helix-turn-helix domain-containing protein [Actinoplanes friuliensis]AGZ44517.1 putative AraC-family transcriptional regulator [Actinoplanes friuliensis DSM 7358]
MVVDESAWARPAAALRPYVAHYSGWRQDGAPMVTHRGLPSPYLTLVLTLDDPLVVHAHPDRRQSPGRYDALLGGLHLSPALIAHGGRQAGVQVAVHPLGCRALFGLPAGELSGLDLDLADLLTDVEQIRERLRAAGTWPERFAALDASLLALARRRHAEVHPDVAHAFGRLLTTGGRLPVRTLADEVGWSPRHLTDRFRVETGLGLKEAARVVRFDRARRRLTPRTRLADLAADSGYYDQAHLTREFRALAGCSPSRWLADEFTFVQDQHASRGEDGSHG